MILNKSYYKLGLQNGKGMTYECMLTTKSIQVAQKYYELLTRVKNGETSLVIDEKIRQVLPDFLNSPSPILLPKMKKAPM